MHKGNLFRKLRRLLVRILVASATPLPDDREAIWSIPRTFQVIYFLIFIGVCVPMIADIARENIAAYPGAGWITLARETSSEFATVGVGAAIGSLIAVQGVAIVVSLYHIITNRFTIPAIEKHRAEGRAEGEEQTNQAWREWLRRRDEAEAQGIPFDEPSPDQRDTLGEQDGL